MPSGEVGSIVTDRMMLLLRVREKAAGHLPMARLSVVWPGCRSCGRTISRVARLSVVWPERESRLE